MVTLPIDNSACSNGAELANASHTHGSFRSGPQIQPSAM